MTPRLGVAVRTDIKLTVEARLVQKPTLSYELQEVPSICVQTKDSNGTSYAFMLADAQCFSSGFTTAWQEADLLGNTNRELRERLQQQYKSGSLVKVDTVAWYLGNPARIVFTDQPNKSAVPGEGLDGLLDNLVHGPVEHVLYKEGCRPLVWTLQGGGNLRVVDWGEPKQYTFATSYKKVPEGDESSNPFLIGMCGDRKAARKLEKFALNKKLFPRAIHIDVPELKRIDGLALGYPIIFGDFGFAYLGKAEGNFTVSGNIAQIRKADKTLEKVRLVF